MWTRRDEGQSALSPVSGLGPRWRTTVLPSGRRLVILKRLGLALLARRRDLPRALIIPPGRGSRLWDKE